MQHRGDLVLDRQRHGKVSFRQIRRAGVKRAHPDVVRGHCPLAGIAQRNGDGSKADLNLLVVDGIALMTDAGQFGEDRRRVG
jgi:hypothetical protein